MLFFVASASCRCTSGEKLLAPAVGAPAARPDSATAAQSAKVSRLPVIGAPLELRGGSVVRLSRKRFACRSQFASLARTGRGCDASPVSAARIAVLGRLGIERESQEAQGRGLPGRRAELVFAYLAVEHRRTVSRDELANALWPDVLPDSWAAALRGVVSDVRRFLEDGGMDPAEVLAAGRGGYQLCLPAGVVVDVDETRGAVAAARQELAAGASSAAAARAGRAAALARLPFLPSHEGEWVDGVRAELDSIHVQALELEVRALAEVGDLAAAAAAAARLVKVEPFKEPGHRLRIRVLGEAGDRAAAVRAYEHCKDVLSSELGVEPSAETEAALREAMERAPAGETAVAPRADGLQVRSVLVVEDHDFQRRTALQLLRGLGIAELSEAEDGASALELLGRSAAPDVIVCDLDMPGMDGVEFIRHVAERKLASAVIIASGLDPGVVHAVEALTEASGLELLGAVEKPLTSRRLAELLDSYRPDPALQGGEGRAPVTAADVAEALDDGRIVVLFRPTVDLSSGSASGAEVLPGWDDAAHGWIGPPTVLPVLDTALVSRFTDHALELACSHLQPFASAGLVVPVSVRVPGPCLRDIGLADRFAEIVRERGADARQVVCAIGERELRPDPATLAALTRLRLKGFGLCVEQFVAAHASAEQLRRVPLTAIKVASSVVSGAGDEPGRVAALEEALERARGLGLTVIAAGCDSAADFELLLRLGCGQAEGAFISEPISGDELPAWAARWRPPSSLVGGAT
jgi:EAL domain-containing protein (putative c-di-GMP-specific phosphodiesterase class I)/DNA-binding SARP family transcriptional activator